MLGFRSLAYFEVTVWWGSVKQRWEWGKRPATRISVTHTNLFLMSAIDQMKVFQFCRQLISSIKWASLEVTGLKYLHAFLKKKNPDNVVYILKLNLHVELIKFHCTEVFHSLLKEERPRLKTKKFGIFFIIIYLIANLVSTTEMSQKIRNIPHT